MMYKNQFVAAVKSGNKVLREVGDTVYLPFGCEYSILLKNLNIVRAEARITIDGEDVLGGNSIVVNPNSDLELERFLKDLSKGNRFKFIERTSSVEQHRGVGAGDGLIRIEWQYEKPRPIYTVRPDPFSSTLWGNNNSPWIRASGATYNVNGALRGVDMSNGDSTRAYAASATNATLQNMGITAQAASFHDGMATMDWAELKQSTNDVGITVPGSLSDQKFATVASFPLEDQKHVIVLQLKGETEYNKVTAPVTVKAKPKCVTCGKVNKATAKFCSNCGTALEIV
jgi:hypothetical protein